MEETSYANDCPPKKQRTGAEGCDICPKLCADCLWSKQLDSRCETLTGKPLQAGDNEDKNALLRKLISTLEGQGKTGSSSKGEHLFPVACVLSTCSGVKFTVHA